MLSASTFAANVTVFGGVNLNQKIESEYQGTTDNYNADKTGYTVGVEAHKEFYKIGNEKVELGVGTKYDSMLKGDVDLDTTTPNEELASTMPVYGSVKLSHKLNKTTSIYLQGKLGYAFAFDGKSIEDVNDDLATYFGGSAKVEGGLYTGVGIGVESGSYVLGLSYDVTNATEVYEIPGDATYKFKDTYTKLALTVGYKFGK